jgi:hypothetical protein
VDAARQVLRFSIPGAVLLLNGMLCFMIYRRAQGVGFDVTSSLLRANVEPLVGIFATIPVGFVVYQAYYFSYGPTTWAWPKPGPMGIVRIDRACEVLRNLPQGPVEQISEAFDVTLDLTQAHERLPNRGAWYRHPVAHSLRRLHFHRLKREWRRTDAEPERIRAYESRWHDNWDVLRGMVDIAASIEGADHVRHEYMTLSDIFHALGAARTAISASWLAAVVLALTHVGRLAESPLDSVVGLLLVTILSGTLWVIFHVARKRTWKSAASSLCLALRWLLHRDPKAFCLES